MTAEVWNNFTDGIAPPSDRFYLQSFASAQFPSFYERSFERFDIDIVDYDLVLVNSTVLPTTLNIPLNGYAMIGLQGGSTRSNLDYNTAGILQILGIPIPVITATPPLAAFPSGARLWSDLPAFLQSHGQEFSPASQSFMDSLVTRLEPFFSNPTVKQFADVSANVIDKESKLIDVLFALSPTNTLQDSLQDALTSSLIPYLPQGAQCPITLLTAIGTVFDQFKLSNPVGALVAANGAIWGGCVAPQLHIFASDPFDPNYQSVVVPSIPLGVPLPSTGNAQLDSSLNRLQATSIQAFVFLQAVQVSFDRYNSALSVGDRLSAGLQLEAILHYLAMYDSAAVAAADLWKQLPTFLQEVTYNASAFQNLQTQVRTAGFPPAIVNYLSALGLTSAQQDALRTTFLSLDPQQFSGTLFGALSGLSASIISVSTARTFIDIKPGEFPNSINPKSNGKIPVAILSTKSFDAVHEIDRTSLTFGQTGDEHSLDFCNPNGEDVNGDKLIDLVCHFDTQKTTFKAGDSVGILKGMRISGIHFIGTDSVQIVPLR
jgi:hypothetical protein